MDSNQIIYTQFSLLLVFQALLWRMMIDYEKNSSSLGVWLHSDLFKPKKTYMELVMTRFNGYCYFNAGENLQRMYDELP